MIPRLLALAFGIALVFAIWRAAFRPDFELRHENGSTRLVRGKIPPRVVAELRRVFEEAGLESATLRGYRGRPGDSLRFSRSVPPHVQQRIKNVFTNF